MIDVNVDTLANVCFAVDDSIFVIKFILVFKVALFFIHPNAFIMCESIASFDL